MNWFTEDKWPLIEAAVKKHRSLSAALHYLKLTHRYVLIINFLTHYKYLSPTSLIYLLNKFVRNQFCIYIHFNS